MSTHRMKTEPLVSVLIANYNYGRFVATAIESVLAQTYPHVEVIVVDDGSTDNSREIIDRYSGRVQAIYKDNGGQASAINAAFAASTGDIICLLDADDYYLPDKVEKAVACYQERDEAVYVFHPLQRVDINGVGLGINEPMDGSRWLDGKVKGFIAPPTSGLTFRRSGWEMLKPMPDGLSPIADNYLKFVIMALARGYYLAEPLAVMKIHGSNMFSMGNWGSTRFPADIRIAVAIRSNFPKLVASADRLVSVTLVQYWRSACNDEPTKAQLKAYLKKSSVGSMGRIYGGAVLRWCKRFLYAALESRRQALPSRSI